MTNGAVMSIEIKELREKNEISKEMAFAAYTAKHLADWYRDNRFCGRCGKAMVHSEKERAMTCKCCGFTSYPRIMPAVIVGVTNGDEILITRYRTGYRHNALIAGFTEIGETLEETVAREVLEETGIRVKNIRYYKSQPWGIANDLLVGFFCEADGDTEICMDEQELRYAQWTKREDIVLQPDNYSLTNEMMAIFKNEKKEWKMTSSEQNGDRNERKNGKTNQKKYTFGISCCNDIREYHACPGGGLEHLRAEDSASENAG